MNFNGTVGGANLPVGYGIVKNLTIVPGDNKIQVRAVQSLGLSLITYALDAKLPILMAGNATVYNGQHIKWLETPLQATTLNVTSPGHPTTLNSTSNSS